MSKPRIRSPLHQGSLVYHGTAVEDPFEMLQGPAWVSDNSAVARHFADMYAYRGGEDDVSKRLMTFRVKKAPRLAIVHDDREWLQFINWVYDGDVVTYDPSDLAEATCNKGLDGWHIVNNYPESGGGSDTLLCAPGDFLELVEVAAMNPLVEIQSTTTIVPLKTALIVGLATTAVALVAGYFIRRSATGALSMRLPAGVDQTLTVDMQGLHRLNLMLPTSSTSAQWVSCMVDGQLVDIPPEANVQSVGLTLTLTQPAGIIVATHRDAGSMILHGLENTVTTIDYANTGLA